ncbi:DUF1553 domain-containing protein [Phragmitibacter flavus]|uniref:DUF1553 domain-containing protein n=1 Tax=Phragmitibacter flavus TaxID=2576071 RepID=A0A5R8KDP3_9BACT|nr:DUF1553 domain-containing protein [Phragmitibacter flavus]TLD70423.1 DUF1553 domain-containing protein [Phragmitibacter flavus]
MDLTILTHPRLALLGFTTLIAAATTTSILAASTAPNADSVQFNRDIRPILAEACFHCHGPDSGTRKADLRLDKEDGFFSDSSDSGPTILKGKPQDSPLYQRIVSTDPDELMPPESSHKTLTAEQKDLIKRWIEQGANWQPHWSLINPTRPESPKTQTPEWARNGIDHFVLAKLEDAKLTPNPEADKRTLARRVSLDLTGLPPSPDLVETFVNNPNPNAYDQLVDQLLQSKSYGEHRARYWLDAARYGDTHGLHFDNYREMWPYRDWVVRAFNNNQPFNQFTLEQLAGDLLPNPTTEQLIATGFQRCNITTNEGGTIDEETLANYAADRVQTLGWVYMGLTVNCAQCHDHKFDPISIHDYYALTAFFRNTTQPAKDGNKKDPGPILVLPSAEDQTRWTALPAELAAADTQIKQRRADAKPQFEQWLAATTPDAFDKSLSDEGLIAHIPLNEGAGNEVTAICGPPAKIKTTGQVSWSPNGKLGPAPVIKPDSTFDIGNSGDFEGTDKFSYGAWVKAGRDGLTAAILARMDEKDAYRGWDLWQQDRKIGVHLIHKFPDNALKVTTKKAVLKPGTWQHVFVTYDGTGKPAGVKIYLDGVEQDLNADNASYKPGSTLRTTTPTRIGQRSHVSVFDSGSIQDVRIYSRSLKPAEVKQLASHSSLRNALAAASEKRTPEQQNALYDHYLHTQDTEFPALLQASAKLTSEQTAIRQRSPLTHIQEEVPNVEPMAKILLRGQYDNHGEDVTAATPAALPPLPEGAPKNRLGLAQWLIADNNPLTARVVVNRFWQELFGKGLVYTSEDFGIMGSEPSHPELLDWLAVEFRDSGWDVKHLYKLMVTSATYRQSPTITPDKLATDRDNSLFSRGPRFRMDAEMVRDYALAASGLLSPKMGGPGTKPYQPEGVWDVVGLPGGDTRNYVQDNGENLYRRTIYNFWKRMAPPPSLDTFNAPSREVSCVRRERTNTPLQALVTLNDPQFIEAARHLAVQTLWETRGDEYAALNTIASRILCRPLTAQETSILQASHADLLKHYQANPADAEALVKIGESPPDKTLSPASIAAWTMVCNQLMNLDEVLNK